MNETVLAEPIKPKDPKKRRIWIIVAVVVAVLICCCVAVVALLAIDPFGWGVFGLLFSKSDAVAQAMPEDTGMYVGINLLNATPEKLDRVISPFQDAVEQMSGEDIGTTQDLMDELDKTLDDELNLSLEDDIMPWIGRYVGIGFTDLEMDEYGNLQEPKFVVAIEVRNKKAADEFLPKLEESIADNTGADFNIDEYNGVEVYELDTDYDYERVAFARSGNLLLLAQDRDAIEEAIDTQKDVSLGDDQVYKDLTKDMPKDRALTFYMTGKQLQDLTKSANSMSLGMMGVGSGILDIYDSVQGLMFSAAITDDGLQFDSVVAYDLDAISDAQLEMLKGSKNKGKTTGMFPESTMVYLQGGQLDLIWDYYREFIIDMAGSDAYDEMMSGLEDEIGFDVEKDLIPYLNGEMALGVFESRDGMLASQMEVDLGLGLLIEVSDEAAVMDVVDEFVNALEDQGSEMDDISTKDITMYEAIDDYSGDPILALGLGNDFLGIATSGSDLENLYQGDTSLSKNDEFNQVWKAFSGGITPSFYINVQGLVEIIRDGLSGYSLDSFEEVAPILEPIQYIAAGGSKLEGNTVHGVLILFLTAP